MSEIFVRGELLLFTDGSSLDIQTTHIITTVFIFIHCGNIFLYGNMQQ